MSLHNVTPTSLDHHCSQPNCVHKRSGLAHTEVEKVVDDTGTLLVLTCPDGHRECFNSELEAWEETSPTRDEASREQVRNVRALHKHLGLTVK